MTTHDGFPRDFNWQWNSCVTYAYLEVPISLITKNRQFVVVGSVSHRNNNLRCYQWWQSCQIDHLMYNWPFVREIYWPPVDSLHKHYTDVIMTAMVSQITSLTVAYSTWWWQLVTRARGWLISWYPDPSLFVAWGRVQPEVWKLPEFAGHCHYGPEPAGNN